MPGAHPTEEGLLSRGDSSRSPTYYHELRYGMAHRSCQNHGYMDLMKQFTVRKQSASTTIADAAAAAAVVNYQISNPMLRKLSKMSFINQEKAGGTRDTDIINAPNASGSSIKRHVSQSATS